MSELTLSILSITGLFLVIGIGSYLLYKKGKKVGQLEMENATHEKKEELIKDAIKKTKDRVLPFADRRKLNADWLRKNVFNSKVPKAK